MTGPVPIYVILLGLIQVVMQGGRPHRAGGLLNVMVGVMLVIWVATLDPEATVTSRLWGIDVVLIEVTQLKLVFAWAFSLAYLLWSVYAWAVSDGIERGSGLVYVGCSFGVLFAGDLLTLFLFWEGMAIASTVVVLRGRTEGAKRAAYRYFMVHILGGVLLLTGIGLYTRGDTSMLRHVSDIGLDTAGGWMILVGYLVNAAAWPLAAWVPDAYPAASPAGNVLLGTYTTKVGVYVIVAAFSGEAVLMVFGAVMALYGFLYAFVTWNYRRLLAYSLVGQVGFMLCAAGVGGHLGESAAAAHALTHVLYKSLLFMSAGAVFLATGSALGGRNGGLWRTMPWTLLCGFIGALAISAVPGTSGYVSKALITDALHESHHPLSADIYKVLLFVTAMAPLYVGLRFPYLAFFGRRPAGEQDAPSRLPTATMRVAQGLTAALCLAIGLFPHLLLDLLPLHGEVVHVYTAAHVLKQLMLLSVGTVLFVVWWAVIRKRDVRRVDKVVDTDTIYVGLGRGFEAFVRGPFLAVLTVLSDVVHVRVPRALGAFARNPAGAMGLAVDRVRLGLSGFWGSDAAIDEAQAQYGADLARYRRAPGGPWPIGRTVLYGALLLALFVIFWLVAR
jgi:multicomponent Na+:H+ antiporter subunit D